MTRILSILGGIALLAAALGIGGWLIASPGGSAGEEWSLIATTNPPADRWGHNLTYANTNNRMLMFGGDQANGNELNDLWSFQLPLGPWTLETPSGGPPAVRRNHSAVWNPGAAEMLVFGGFCGPSCSYNDVWSYSVNTNTWTLLANNGTPPPPGYDFHAAWDSINENMLVFGGYDDSVHSDDLWQYNRATETWTQLSPVGGPPTARQGGAAVWEELGSRMLVFGGWTGSASLNDLWEYSPTSNQWTQLTPTGTPPAARWAMGETWDPDLQRLLIFGGRDGATLFDDTWAYNTITNDWE
jgi:N-acetylneuraminic acid mutarotase